MGRQTGCGNTGDRYFLIIIAKIFTMNIIRFNPKIDDDKRRQLLFDGDFILYSKTEALKNLVAFAGTLIEEAYGDQPEKAQFGMDVADFIKQASALKTKFTNHATTKELIKALLAETKCDETKTYFDVVLTGIETISNSLPYHPVFNAVSFL